MLAHEVRRPSAGLRIGKPALSADQFLGIGILLESALIISVAAATGLSYHLAAHGHQGPTKDFILIGILIALFNALPAVIHSHYGTKNVLPGERGYGHVFRSWNFAFFCIAALGFLTKSTELQSRGWLILLYTIGLIGSAGFEGVMGVVRHAAIRSGWLTTRRLLLVGERADVERFMQRSSWDPTGIKVAATALLPPPESTLDYLQELNASVRRAVAAARTHNVSDVVVLTDWAAAPRFTHIAEKLMDVPAAVHLGGLGVVEKFSQLGVDQLGTTTTVVLRQQPVGLLKSLAKRAFDVCASGVVLIVLAPLFALIALLIKYDSPGPIFFRQRRRGFNQREFRIWKFRTMTTADDGEHIVQATAEDVRVTRFGRFLRKWNIDEIPQLMNVLRGDMSLVGPRPHAVAHDTHYERIIERYGRRLNVKPGITGWAQIHGYRGPTETKGAMQARVVHDLYYIEHCSMTLDIYILFMTLLSRNAYRNAY